MTPRVWTGELLRWYLTTARHPFKDYLVGHYWWAFCKPRVWIRYDDTAVISVCLGEYIQQRIFFDGYYERPLIDWLKRTIVPGDVFWDVGANIGAVTLVAARLCQRVVAFEPDPRSIRQLTRNLAINSVRNVELVPAALDEHSGTAVLHQADRVNTGMSSIASPAASPADRVDVQTVRGDDLLADRPELAPTIIKIDVEGAESRVLAGATRLLESGRVRAVVFEDRVGARGEPTNVSVLDRLSSAGYQVRPLGASAENVGDGMFNYLATRGALVGTGA